MKGGGALILGGRPRATPPLGAIKRRVFNAEGVVGSVWSLLVGGGSRVELREELGWAVGVSSGVGRREKPAVELETGEVTSRREVASNLRNSPSDRAPSRSSGTEE